MECMVDVAVIGAGLAGLSCARYIHDQGYAVMVIEKSRGLGGRVATRRMDNIWFDYGARYIEAVGHQTCQLLKDIEQQAEEGTSSFVQWPLKEYVVDAEGHYQLQPQPQGYVPKMGMTAIAKHLAEGLEVRRQQRVQRLQLNSDKSWTIYVESQSAPFTSAQAIVIAIPAPQVVPLLLPLRDVGLPSDFLASVQAIEFDPCITVITGYPETLSIHHPRLGKDWDAIRFHSHDEIAWVGVNSKKYGSFGDPPMKSAGFANHVDSASSGDETHQHCAVIVTQSSAAFARHHSDEVDMPKVGDRLLAALATQLQSSAIAHPQWMHVHRWRYGFCHTPLAQPYMLTHIPALLGCTGDWCGGTTIDDALTSGQAIGRAILTAYASAAP